MTRWKLTIEYDGTNFCGWQRQKNGATVQQTIEEAFTKFIQRDEPILHCAGRTDSGVHAYGQVAHVDLETNITASALQGALNFYLKPHPIGILKVEKVPEDFHARFKAKNRSYIYKIINRRAPLTLMKNKAYHVKRKLNLAPMQEAAAKLIGHHDFSTFRAYGCQANSPMRTLDELTITQEGELFTIKVKAQSFLYHQVRNMAGTLILVGTGHWTMQQFEEAFAAKDRTKGGPTAPSDGLYFLEVGYDE